MKKTLSIFVIALFLFAPMTTNAGLFDFFNNFKASQPAQVIKSSNSFERGDKDEKILEVQTILKDQGIYDGWLSGAFGPKTEAAIKDFQSKNGLNTTGVLDPKTYEYIVGGTEKDNNSRGGGQPGSGNQPLTALEAMCNQDNPLWIKVLSPADNAQYASNYVAQPVFALCRMAGLGANNSLSIRMEYGGFVDVIQGQTNISNSTVFNVTNPYPNIWYIEYLPGIDFTNDYDGDGEYEIKAIFHNDIYPGVDAMDEVSIQIGGGQQVCNEEDVVVSIAVDTPTGIQDINQFNVLKFTVENNSGCDILFDDFNLSYMTTDGKPYFEEIQLRDEQNNFLGENDEILSDVNFYLGENLDITFDQQIQINSGSAKDFIVRAVNFEQPVFDNTVPYNDYIYKYLLFGFGGTNHFDFQWESSGLPLNPTLDPYNGGWGNIVRIPPTSL